MKSALLFALPLSLLAQAPAVQAPAPAPAAEAPAAPAATPAPAPAPAPLPTAVLDKGLLQMSWYGQDLAFAKTDDIDFYWVKPGLKLAGHTICFKPWEDPAMLEKGRDGKDNSKATALTDSMPSQIRGALNGAFEGKAKVSRSEGDLEMLGRVVDCNAGSKAAKFMIGLGAGSATVTWDMKLVDPRTHELLMAVHHRVVSATIMSDIEDKVAKWADKFARQLAGQNLD